MCILWIEKQKSVIRNRQAWKIKRINSSGHSINKAWNRATQKLELHSRFLKVTNKNWSHDPSGS